MAQVIIENPITNSPYCEPTRHFHFSDEGITDKIDETRRVSSYFIPIAQPKKKSPEQLAFETEWTADRIEENKFINDIRESLNWWRHGGYVGLTKTTAGHLEYWKRPDRERRLFFCQIEALETAIYINEVARRYGDAWIENSLRQANERANPLLFRIALRGWDRGLLNLITEVSGEKKKDKEAKVTTASTLQVPAVNNHGGFGHRTFLEIKDPWDAQSSIRRHMDSLGGQPTCMWVER